MDKSEAECTARLYSLEMEHNQLKLAIKEAEKQAYKNCLAMALQSSVITEQWQLARWLKKQILDRS